MHYEIYTREEGPQVERIMLTLMDRHQPFVEIRVDDAQALSLENETGQSLPLVMQGERMIGGFSDLVNHLRHPSRTRFTFPLGAKGRDSFSQPR